MISQRFWDKVDRSGDCWMWTGSTFHNGYGAFFAKVDGKKTMQRAHRVSYEHHNGKIEGGAIVCHRCDNRACVNPDHLFVGQPKDNSKDMVDKRRSARGEGHGRSRLTEDDVYAIRKSVASNKILAEAFGVSERTIRDVKARRTWWYL